MSLQPQPLPSFEAVAEGRYPYGARSEAAVFVGDLLVEEVPALGRDGPFEMVAIARRPGVLSKVAIRQRSSSLAPVTTSIGADHLARVSRQLDGERIEVVRWQRSARAYIAAALGLGEEPPVVLLPGIAHACVLLGEIDVRGIAGWRGLNTVLASALTGWRIRLEPVAATQAWRRLETAMHGRWPVTATVVGPTARGVRLEVAGLHAVLGGATSGLPIGREVEVTITRMDPDEGRILATNRLGTRGQLPLI